MPTCFDQLDRIRFKGTQSTNPLVFRHYNPDKIILGKRMEDHLRFTACYWHIFCWNGANVFGMGAFDRPWQQPGEALALAKRKADMAFEFFHKPNVPYYCFHDVDVSPEDASLEEYRNNFAQMADALAAKREQSGVKLLRGTANYFTNPHYGAGATTNSDPEVFSWAATQAVTAMGATHKLGNENYVLWDGRGGYGTPLNTDLRQKREQIGRFMQLVVEHKHKIDFQGTLLIEPKPQEPTKHQYNYDAATVYRFLKQFGPKKETELNIEASHTTLADHSFHHEVATAIVLGLLGSVGANRGDVQLSWDTNQFLNSVEENALVMCEILEAGGFTTGDLNFNTKVRRQSTDKYDLFYGRTDVMDTMALSLKITARMIGGSDLDQRVARRYTGWDGELDQQTLKGQMTLTEITQYAEQHNLTPVRRSDHQELLGSPVNHYLFDK